GKGFRESPICRCNCSAGEGGTGSHGRGEVQPPCGSSRGVPHSPSPRRFGLDFEVQLPGGELAQEGIEAGLPRSRVSKDPFTLNADRPRRPKRVRVYLVARPEFEPPFVQVDFFPRSQDHFHWLVKLARYLVAYPGDRLALRIRHGGRRLHEEL